MRLATVRETKVSISLTVLRWKKPNVERSAAMPRMMGSLSVPMNFKMEMQVSLTIVVVVGERRCQWLENGKR